MITVIAIACLAAVAYGEAGGADPAVGYKYQHYYPPHLGYAGQGYGYYGYAGHYYGKREAEPEAKAESDPYLLYGGYGHHLGYAGHYGYPYTNGYYGKRDAEAKPEADPALLYGGYYGHHLGYAGHYGYAGYPYAYWG